jgi:hypothetical protein
MRLDSALADSSLMQSALIIHGQIWVDPMHHVLQKKVPQLQFGSQHDHLTLPVQPMPRKLPAFSGKTNRLFLGSAKLDYRNTNV